MSPQAADQPLRALIYNRASSDPSGRALSVAAQERENRAWCEREGWTVAGTVTDNDRSATRFARREREGYQQVKKALGGAVFGRVDLLVCWESSRATRDMDGFVELRKLCAAHGVRFAAKGRILDFTDGGDRFVGGVDALVDERFADEARDRTLRGHRTSVQNGTPRSYAGYGYRYVRDGRTGKLVGQERDPDTAPVVEEMVRRIIGGDPLYRIAQSLNERGVPTAMQRIDQQKGRDVTRLGWSTSMIRNVLARHGLMGVRTWHGQAMGPAAWEPIVSPSDWRQVQSILGERRRGSGHDTRARTLLSGVATCGVCGAWMRPLLNRGRHTYVCAGLVPTGPKGHVSRGRDALDGWVTRCVVEMLRDPDLIADVARRRQGDVERVDDTERRIADLRVELAGYVRSAAARSGMARTAFESVVDDLAGQIETLEASVQRSAALPEVVLSAAGPDAASKWNGLSLEKRRGVVRSLLRVVVHRASTPGSRVFDASTVEVVPH